METGAITQYVDVAQIVLYILAWSITFCAKTTVRATPWTRAVKMVPK